ncbi:MAG: 30S ribosomal protein S17 [Pirellulales bacterium]|nr:30S ribosomal protein S17 [Pirellulales bacterium]MBX3431852.1 30S ribosomal protein S17 [Pirellulales bacterium]
MPKKVMTGVVTGDKCAKTRRVEINRLERHPKYGKFIRKRTVCHVHDEANESAVGDTVEIVECPPKSKLKRWDLVRVVAKSQLVDIAAMRAAAKQAQAAEGAN